MNTDQYRFLVGTSRCDVPETQRSAGVSELPDCAGPTLRWPPRTAQRSVPTILARCAMLLSAFQLLSISAFGGTAVITLLDMQGNPLPNEQTVLTYAGLPQSQYGGTAVKWRTTLNSDANGMITLTNAAAGKWTVAPVDPNTVGFAFYMPATNGTIQVQYNTVADAGSTLPPGTMSYDVHASDLRYAPIGSTGGGGVPPLGSANIAITPNNGSNQISLTGTIPLAQLPSAVVTQYGIVTNEIDANMMNLPHWRYALARAKAGLGEARVLFVGDSTTAGFGNGSPGQPGYTNAEIYSYPQQLASYFPNGSAGSFVGSHILAGTTLVTNVNQYDQRMTMGGWSMNPTFVTAGWAFLQGSTANTNAFTFTPSEQCNYAQVWYIIAPGNGGFSVTVDGQAATNLDSGFGSLTYTNCTVDFATGKHTIGVWQTNTSGGSVFLSGIVTGNSSNGVELVNAGMDASRTADWAQNWGVTYGPSNVVWQIAPDLVVVNLGINDTINSVPLTTSSNNYVLLGKTWCSTNTDVLFVSPNPIQTGGTASYDPLLQGICAANNWGFLSMNRWFMSSWTQMNNYGFAYNSLHLNRYGYRNEADYIAQSIGGGMLTAATSGGSGTPNAVLTNSPTPQIVSTTLALTNAGNTIDGNMAGGTGYLWSSLTGVPPLVVITNDITLTQTITATNITGSVTNYTVKFGAQTNLFDLAGAALQQALAATNGLGALAFDSTITDGMLPSSVARSYSSVAWTNTSGTMEIGSVANAAVIRMWDVNETLDQLTASGNALLWNGDGIVTNNMTGVTLSGTFSGNGGGLTNIQNMVRNVLFTNSTAGATLFTTNGGIVTTWIGTNGFGGSGGGGGNVYSNTATTFSTVVSANFIGGGQNISNLMAQTAFNVQAYGATGNGSTDDTLAISNTISALQAHGGGTIYFPLGRYLVKTNLTISGVPFTWIGDSRGPDDWQQANSTNVQSSTQLIISNSTATLLVISNCPSADFERMAFVNLTNNLQSTLMLFTSTNITPYFIIDKCSFHGGGNQVNILEGEGWQIRSCGFYNCTSNAITVQNLNNADYGDWFIGDGCYFANYRCYGSNAIYIATSGGGKIEGCKINSYYAGGDGTACLQYGIQVVPNGNTSDLMIVGNSVENCCYAGIWGISPGGNTWQNINVVGNQFYNMYYGISLQPSVTKNFAVQGNTFDTVTYPLNFYNASFGVVSGNISDTGMLYPSAGANVGYSATGTQMYFPMTASGYTNLSAKSSFVALFPQYMVDTNFTVTLTGVGAALTNYWISGVGNNGFIANFPSAQTLQVQWSATHQ